MVREEAGDVCGSKLGHNLHMFYMIRSLAA